MNNLLHVFFNDIKVGTLDYQESLDKKYIFKYDKNYLISHDHIFPLTGIFPLQEEPFISNKLFPLFENIIMEGWLLEVSEKILKIDKGDKFSLLNFCGEFPIGALFLKNEVKEKKTAQYIENKDLKKYSFTPALTHLCSFCMENHDSKKCALKLWGTLRDISVQLNESDPILSFSQLIYKGSISGAQRKGLFALEKNVLIPRAEKTHFILKPKGNFSQLPENEFLTMCIAKKLGFSVPPFALMMIDELNERVFVIKRFDVLDNETKLGFFDMAQMLSIPSTAKYQSSCERVAQVIKKYSSAPLEDLKDYFKRILFSYVVGNTDMHLKNWGILQNPLDPKFWMLSPCYDLLHTKTITHDNEDMSLSLMGKKSHFKKKNFIEFGNHIGLSERSINSVFQEIESGWWSVIKEMVDKSLLTSERKENYLKIAQQYFNNLNEMRGF